MRFIRVILIVSLACLTGCTSGRLRQRTINQGSTIPDLQYQQVLDNLALFVCDNNAENWIAPTHSRDLRAIVKQYRRSLPAYTDYHILTQKKNILQQMETILTTY